MTWINPKISFGNGHQMNYGKEPVFRSGNDQVLANDYGCITASGIYILIVNDVTVCCGYVQNDPP